MAHQPVVTVKQGQLLGRVVKSIFGQQYFSFQGIPYAKPPVGTLRFKAPQPPESWKGLREALEEGQICFSRHYVSQQLVGSEDCLFLNVYTPELPSKNTFLRPVMVWIHGGAFSGGSGNTEFYGPDFLLQGDVVLVTINYRLGFLGFLNFEDPSLNVPGNAGLKDQVMALKWVQENISQFAGDSNNVTIFGESAGGASVHYLMLSPMAKGLFHRAIAQSGTALGCWARGQRSAPLLAKHLGLDTVDEKKTLKALQEMSVKEIIKLQESLPDHFIASHIRPFGPVIETSTAEPTFLTEQPEDLLASGRFNQVPFMTGYTSREGMLVEATQKGKGKDLVIPKNFEKVVPHTLCLTRGSEKSKQVAKKIKEFFYGSEEPTLDNIDQYFLLQSDCFFIYPLYTSIKLQLSSSPMPIYLYRMSVESSLNIFKIVSKLNERIGACHADDIGYLFNNPITPQIRPGSIEDEAIRRFVTLWTNFAREGDPNPKQKDPLINVTWKPVKKDNFYYLEIGENLTIGVNPELGRMTFWDEIYCLNPISSKL